MTSTGEYGGIDEPYDMPGIPFGDSKPGDWFAEDADLTVYWPWVRPVWEEDHAGAETPSGESSS